MTFANDLKRKPIKETEYFSDEEIAMVKEKFPRKDRIHALLARLEAAEHAIAATVGEFENSPSVQAWRKACGK